MLTARAHPSPAYPGGADDEHPTGYTPRNGEHPMSGTTTPTPAPEAPAEVAEQEPEPQQTKGPVNRAQRRSTGRANAGRGKLRRRAAVPHPLAMPARDTA
jgi:hypothetical protein